MLHLKIQFSTLKLQEPPSLWSKRRAKLQAHKHFMRLLLLPLLFLELGVKVLAPRIFTGLNLTN